METFSLFWCLESLSSFDRQILYYELEQICYSISMKTAIIVLVNKLTRSFLV